MYSHVTTAKIMNEHSCQLKIFLLHFSYQSPPTSRVLGQCWSAVCHFSFTNCLASCDLQLVLDGKSTVCIEASSEKQDHVGRILSDKLKDFILPWRQWGSISGSLISKILDTICTFKFSVEKIHWRNMKLEGDLSESCCYCSHVAWWE